MNQPIEPAIPKLVIDGPPPLLGTWSRVYRAVLIYLAIVIACLYLFMRLFS
jgi:hypothetical protein